MEESKLFKNIWRFNAIVIALAGSLAVIVLLFFISIMYQDNNRRQYRTETVNIDSEANIQELFRLGKVIPIKGSNSIMFPLYSDQKFPLGYSRSKSTNSTRNILFSNLLTKKSHWLLPNNSFLISHHKLLNESNTYSSDQDIVAIIYHIVKADTNGDERLTKNDLITVALTDIEGANYTEILPDIQELLGYKIINKDSIAISFNRDEQGYIYYIDMNTYKITEEIMLPKIPEKL